MSVEPGTKLGAFEITALLGKGGMGEVYRARDTKLGRDVAIKVLTNAIADDSEYLARFEREARTLAALDHPNVGALYGFEHADRLHFLVMQLVEGESLAERIERGPLSVREALPVFAGIARGLSAAHEAGIVHRDLKPANLRVTASGDVKVLDFGIAKETIQGDIDPNAPTTPMTSSPVTGAGVLMGTPHYMSPEQARGKPVDLRTDVWAFGCCLYEALTGDMPFQGETITDIVVSIVERSPDWSKLPDSLPRELTRLLRRCLEKDKHHRPQSMYDIAMILDDLLTDLREGRLTTQQVSAVSSGPIRSLVVLPFENLMGAKEQEYFVDGMTDALTAELSKIKALKVISRGSAMRYKGTPKTMPQIARELGVEGLVEGSIFRAGDDVRITAELVDGRTDEHVWSESFTGTIDTILQLQSDVALAIAKAVQVVVTPEEKKQITSHREVSRDVQKALWEASYHFNRQSSDGYRNAVKLYERAIELDPDHPMSYVGLAAAHWVPSVIGLIRPREGLEKAERAARRAAELDPDHASVQMTMGYIAMAYHHDWERARTCFDRAIELSPNHAEARGGVGLWYLAMSEYDTAIRELKRARELDPLSPMFANNLALAYALSGDYGNAHACIEEAISLSSNFVLARLNRGSFLSWAGRHDEAIAVLEDEVQRTNGLAFARGCLACAYAGAERRREAEAILRDLASLDTSKYVPAFMIAVAYAALGKSNESFRWLERAIEEREWVVVFSAAGRYVDPLRADSRFEDVLKRLNFPSAVRWKALEHRQQQRPVAPAASARRGWRAAMLAVAVAAGAVAGVLAGPWLLQTTENIAGSAVTPAGTQQPRLPVHRFTIQLPPDEELSLTVAQSVDIAPDGSAIVYSTQERGQLKMNVQPLDAFSRVTLQNIDEVAQPHISPDGEWVVTRRQRNSEAELIRVPLYGGNPALVARVPSIQNNGAHWAEDGFIYYMPALGDAIWRIPAEGGDAERITTVESGEMLHAFPQLLPSGKHLLFSAIQGRTGESARHVYVQDLETGTRKHIMRAGYAKYVSSGHLLYVPAVSFGKTLSLHAVPFDLDQLQAVGDGVSVLHDVLIHILSNYAHVAVADNGTLAYVPKASIERQPVWVDPSGTETPLDLEPGIYGSPRISPDSQTLLLSVGEGNSSIWSFDLERNLFDRFIHEDGAVNPLWLLDGQAVAYNAISDRGMDMKLSRLKRSGPPVNVSNIGELQWPATAAGDLMAVNEIEPGRLDNYDIGVYRIQSDLTLEPVEIGFNSETVEGPPTLSPDGRWAAFSSLRAGFWRVYVARIAATNEVYPVSTAYGSHPMWSPQGDAIYFHGPGTMTRVPVTITDDSIQIGQEEPLFPTNPYEMGDVHQPPNFDLSHDGSRFLMLKRMDTSTREMGQINVVLNWFEELERLAPTRDY